MTREVAEHAEVDVDDRAVAPVMEEMLSASLRAHEDFAVQAAGLSGEARLNGGCAHPAIGEIPVLRPGEAMEDGAFRHRWPRLFPKAAESRPPTSRFCSTRTNASNRPPRPDYDSEPDQAESSVPDSPARTSENRSRPFSRAVSRSVTARAWPRSWTG